MATEVKKQREKVVLDKFHKLLRCGKSFTTVYMYEESGKEGYMGIQGAQAIVSKYYHSLITIGMVNYACEIYNKGIKERTDLFARKFNVCPREALLIMGYIWRKKQ